VNQAHYSKVPQKHHKFWFGPRDSGNMIKYEDVGETAHEVDERLDENMEQKVKMDVTVSIAQIYPLKATQEKRHKEYWIDEGVIWGQA
jgi:hypothetical protein